MKTALATICALSLCACTASNDTSIGQDDPAFDAEGKLDSFFSPTLHGELAFGDKDRATFTASEGFHAWDFTLPGTGTVTAETSPYRRGGREVDTVLYLYRLEGGRFVRPYVERNDDANDDTTWSRIERRLRAGTYRLLAKADEGAELGAFTMTLGCEGAGCTAGAPTSMLRVPLLQEENDALLTEFNPQLTAAGLMPLPEFVELAANNEGKEYDDIQTFLGSDAVEAAFPDGPPYARAYGDPDSYAVTLPDGREVEMCYTGDPADITALLFSLPDRVFSDMFVVWAYRYGTETWKDGDAEDMGDAWDDYDTRSRDILVLYSTTDGGDDENASTISPCE